MVTKVKCPTCQSEVEWGPQSPFRPFCSKRCQLIDLGEWADEEKRIPGEINPDLPEQLELICMKAMAPDLEKRYPSADAMIADLEAFRKNPGVNLDFELSDLWLIWLTAVPSAPMVAGVLKSKIAMKSSWSK